MEEQFNSLPRLTSPPVQPRRTAPPAREETPSPEQERMAKLAEIAAQIAALRAEDEAPVPAAGRAGHRFVAKAERVEPPVELAPRDDAYLVVESDSEDDLPAPLIRPRRPRGRKKMPLVMQLVLGMYFGAQILGFGWLVGRVLAGRTVRAVRAAREAEAIRSASAAGWTAADSQVLDAIMADLRDRRLDDAARRADELLTSRPELPGVSRLAAEVEFQRGKYAAALVRINAPDPIRTSLRRALDRADVFAALNRTREIEVAVVAAVLEDPFSSAGRAAEAIVKRRVGRLREARDLLDQAIVRARPGRRPSDSWLRVQSLLTRMESGDALAPAELAELPVGWRAVVAAAGAAYRRDFGAARDGLRQASADLPRAEMRAVLMDLLFEPHVARPELREFYARDEASR